MAVSLPIVSEFDGTGIKKAIAEFKQLETTGNHELVGYARYCPWRSDVSARA